MYDYNKYLEIRVVNVETKVLIDGKSCGMNGLLLRCLDFVFTVTASIIIGSTLNMISS